MIKAFYLTLKVANMTINTVAFAKLTKINLSNDVHKKVFGKEKDNLNKTYNYYISDFQLDVYTSPSFFASMVGFLNFIGQLPFYFIGLDSYYFKKHLSEKIATFRLDSEHSLFKSSYIKGSFEYNYLTR